MASAARAKQCVRLMLVGDVMLGRGIDQILEHKNDPVLYEGYVKDATEYVELAVRVNGPLPSVRGKGYVWGDTISILDQAQFKPSLRIINLETAITSNADPAPRKGIHYRMHPGNIDVLKAAKIDCVVLSNNHVLDWCQPGLLETMFTLRSAEIPFAGAGANSEEASAPAIFEIDPAHRVLVFAGGDHSSGVIGSWAASTHRPGVNVVETTDKYVKLIAGLVKKHRRSGDIVLFSIHWGSNWDWDVEKDHVTFAHKLIDVAKVDLIHGHSSHHVKGIEVYKGKLILYGCGDFLSDYEGIASASVIDEHAEFRDDASLLYLPEVALGTGRLTALQMVPMRLKRLQVVRAEGEDRAWLWGTMTRECAKWGTQLVDRGDHFEVLL